MASFSQDQVNNANIILSVGRSMGATPKQLQAAFAAAWVESRLRNLDYGDRDSLGLFQQRPSQGWGTRAQVTNPEYAARKFFETAQKVSQSGTFGQLAQRVQRSGFPLRYDEQGATPLELLTRLMGGVITTADVAPILNGSALTEPNGTADNTTKYIVYGAAGILAFLFLTR